MTYLTRLDLLVKLTQIEAIQAERIQFVLNQLEKEFKISFKGESAERFVTHYAGMYMRFKSGSDIDAMPEEVLVQLKDEAYYPQAQHILTHLVQFEHVPLNERPYFLLHLVHFLSSTHVGDLC